MTTIKIKKSRSGTTIHITADKGGNLIDFVKVLADIKEEKAEEKAEKIKQQVLDRAKHIPH
jgi:hypothetical protein